MNSSLNPAKHITSASTDTGLAPGGGGKRPSSVGSANHLEELGREISFSFHMLRSAHQ
eukprot:m.640056 g.640056  ORF g.640056 m.640056 type:complete len:58 (-) comp22619_c0_seq10:1017-1190(-)